MTSRTTLEGALAALVSLIVGVAALGGFFIGRVVTDDAFIQKVGAYATDDGSTLLSAGTVPLSLELSVRGSLGDPIVRQALAKAYDTDPLASGTLERRLRDIVWMPPYRPAPFVGHLARAYFGEDLRINTLGFRDERNGYSTKPERTVRVFITGGSTAWGTGASRQRHTISYELERVLNEKVGQETGYRYEVINAAFPAWSTTQEMLLIQQRLIDLHPDVIIMFSGNNDVHWSLQGRDIRWFYSYSDQNYITALNEMYRSGGHPEWTTAFPFSSDPIDCDKLGSATSRNVKASALAAQQANAQLFFVLQPNLASTDKRLSEYERRTKGHLAGQLPLWEACYQALRTDLSRITAPNYHFLDFSRAFGEFDENSELFVDAYHFVDAGTKAIARELARKIDWRMIPAGAAVGPAMDPLTILKVDPIERSPDLLRLGSETTVRVRPNRVNNNLKVIFDRTPLPTVIGKETVTASIPRPLVSGAGAHKIYLADTMTGEVSESVTVSAP